MDTSSVQRRQTEEAANERRRSHVVAMPYPARGHINPMMTLCKFIASKKNDILITMVLTEEWHHTIASEDRPANVVFATISNDIIPSAQFQSADVVTFFREVVTKMAGPFEQIVDRMDPPATTIITDNMIPWAVEAGYQRNIPVALFWAPSATAFTIFFHADLFENGIPVDMEAHGNDVVDFIPGIPLIRIADLPRVFLKDNQPHTLRRWPYKYSPSKVKCLLIGTVYGLEPLVCDVFKAKLEYPVYSVGPLIPYYDLNSKHSSAQEEPHYLQWLNSHPPSSVLYISMGSLFSISSAQMDEMVAGLKTSGVRFLWVARDEANQLEDAGGRDVGLLVPWCHQLKVLCHPSVGGFLTHCGWNSILEAGYAGVPVLTFPLSGDQMTQSKQAVEDFKFGLRLKSEMAGRKTLVTREEIAETVQTLMDVNGSQRKRLVEKAKEFQEICEAAVRKGGSSDADLDAFMQNI